MSCTVCAASGLNYIHIIAFGLYSYNCIKGFVWCVAIPRIQANPAGLNFTSLDRVVRVLEHLRFLVRLKTFLVSWFVHVFLIFLSFLGDILGGR